MSTGRKRASTGHPDSSSATASKRQRRTDDPHADAKAFLTEVTNAGDADELDCPEKPVLFDRLCNIASYVHHLEDQLKAAHSAAEASQKTPEELEDAAEKIRRAAVAGIKKQMSWKPSCKQNSAKFSYDGICVDPEVFGHIFKQDGPPKWKIKRLPKQEFEDCVGDIRGAARYNSLYITGTHVNVRWAETGEFKFSGTYGIART